MSFARHHLLIVAGVLLGILQLAFPEALVRFSAALSKLFGKETSELEIREGTHAFRIIGALTLVLFVFLGLRSALGF
jgi:hypothetical protein